MVAGALIGLGVMWAFLRAPMPRAIGGLLTQVEAQAPGIKPAGFFFISVTVADNFDDIRHVLGMAKGAT